MRWTDSREIAIALADKFPDTDAQSVRFTDLAQWVSALEGFSDASDHCNEKVLEAIQMLWMEESA